LEAIGYSVAQRSHGNHTTPIAMNGPAVDDSHPPGDFARKTAQGALVSIVGQGANFALRAVSMVVLARLVAPEHFGLVGMVTAFTGLLSLFRDGGLAAAMVQKETVSEEVLSALFWINLTIGIVLALLTIAAAPLLAAFYGEPRLIGITIALASSFVFNGAMAQHGALLQRRMRFGMLNGLGILALIVSICIGTGMAAAGLGYWALVAMAASQPMINFVGLWLAAGWKPGPPSRAVGVGAMLHYGGLITLNSLLLYVAFNVDKVLLGRFFGPQVLGLYGRAYQLISLPTDNLNTTLGWVMFPALSRVQGDPPRLRGMFLKSYGLFLAIVVPVSVACGLFAEEIVRVLLGPQWGAAVPVFRLLVPTILAFAMINPMGQLMQATGQAARSLKLAFLIAPVAIAGYALGLSNGAQGVALGFSAAMMLLVGPVVYWSRKATLITMADVARAVAPPALSTVAGAALALAVGQAIPASEFLLRLAILPTILFVTHILVLAFCFGQKQVYADLLHRVFGSRTTAVPAKRQE
jgi:O-antigen/teichoic acid export membrane protein